MRIGIDVQTLETHERTRGLGRLCLDTVSALMVHAPQHEYFLFGLNPSAPAEAADWLAHGARYIQIRTPDNPRQYLEHGCAAPFLWTTPEARTLDLYHVTSPLMFDILLPSTAPCPVVATLADAIPAAMHDAGTPMLDDAAWSRYQMRVRVMARWEQILCISQSAADDGERLLGLAPDRMSVVHVAIEQDPLAGMDEAQIRSVLDRYRLQAGGVVSVTGFHPRKNIGGTLRAYGRLPRDLRDSHPLVLVCSLQDSELEQVLREAEAAGVTGHLRVTGYAPHRDALVIMHQAAVMFFPSRYEGFGLPAAEAMSVGVPVVTADNSSLPEVVGDAGFVRDADDEAGFARVLEQLLTDGDLRRRTGEAGRRRCRMFSPEAHARKVEAAYRRARETMLISSPEAASGAAEGCVEPRLRLACFSPFHPKPSGVSEYAERLLLHLGEDAAIDCFVEHYWPENHLCRERFTFRHHSAFVQEHARQPYDVVLYHLGNNSVHAYMIPILDRYPGVVVLHDGLLVGLYRRMAMETGESCPDLPSGEVRVEPRTIELLSKQHAVVVHSEWLKDRLHNAGLDPTRIHVLLQPVDLAYLQADRAPRAALREKYGLPPDGFVISAIGVISPYKRLESALEAFVLMREEVPEAFFVLAGTAERETLRSLMAFCARYRIKHRVRFLGYRETSELYDIAAMSDLFVNMRHPSFGESSATLALIMGMGCPAVVTAGAQFSEFPDSVVWKARPDANEISDLYHYFRYLHEHPEVRMALGANARNLVRPHTWEVAGRLYRGIVDAVRLEAS